MTIVKMIKGYIVQLDRISTPGMQLTLPGSLVLLIYWMVLVSKNYFTITIFTIIYTSDKSFSFVIFQVLFIIKYNDIAGKRFAGEIIKDLFFNFNKDLIWLLRHHNAIIDNPTDSLNFLLDAKWVVHLLLYKFQS